MCPDLRAASLILEISESLNRSLQSSSLHVDRMMNSVRFIKSELLIFVQERNLLTSSRKDRK